MTHMLLRDRDLLAFYTEPELLNLLCIFRVHCRLPPEITANILSMRAYTRDGVLRPRLVAYAPSYRQLFAALRFSRHAPGRIPFSARTYQSTPTEFRLDTAWADSRSHFTISGWSPNTDYPGVSTYAVSMEIPSVTLAILKRVDLLNFPPYTMLFSNDWLTPLDAYLDSERPSSSDGPATVYFETPCDEPVMNIIFATGKTLSVSFFTIRNTTWRRPPPVANVITSTSRYMRFGEVDEYREFRAWLAVHGVRELRQTNDRLIAKSASGKALRTYTLSIDQIGPMLSYNPFMQHSIQPAKPAHAPAILPRLPVDDVVGGITFFIHTAAAVFQQPMNPGERRGLSSLHLQYTSRSLGRITERYSPK